MRILVRFCVDSDMIECPNFIVNDLESYQNRFTEWLYDKANDHAYWTYEDGEKFGCSYRSEAFVEWLNQFVLDTSTEKAQVLEMGINEDGIICRVEYPNNITPMIQARMEEFRQWLSDQDSEGVCREEMYQKQYGIRKYRGYASAEWLNSFILNESNEKAYVIDNQIDCDEMKEMLKIYF